VRAQILGTLLTLSLVGSQKGGAAESEPLRPADRAFRFLAALPSTFVEPALESLRPIPISSDDKRRALASLPSEGELHPTPDEAAKLSGVQQVLIYHKRQDVFEAKVIDLPEAGIVLHARSILLISRPALRLLSTGELQAVVAHEAGHEYFWTEFEHLRDGRDVGARQELELRCDAIAILTLLELHLDPAQLISAVRKITRFNERHGATMTARDYPTTAERAQFIRRIVDAHRRSDWRP
jgi:Zn-dependent protease with chaperone function